MRWLTLALYWLRRLFSSAVARKIIDGIRRTEPYLPEIYDWVRTAAQLTPTRSDDEILRVADALGVPLLLDPTADRGMILAEIVFRAAKRKWPQAPDRVLRRAIEVAYGGVKP